jgi:excisionase family DNA binding protein
MRDASRGTTLSAQLAAELLDQPLLSIAEVARLLKLSPKRVRRLVARGSLPCYRIGRLVRFAPGDVFRWLEARKEG